MKQSDLTSEIRRITADIAAEVTAKALAVSEQAASRAAEVATLATAKAAETSTLAIAEALKTSTVAAQKAADAATAAASIATATSVDLTRIKEDIKEIKVKLDDKYVTKEEFNTVRLISYGLVGTICLSVVGGLMTLLLTK